MTYHYVYYLKYNELKSFFGHRVWAPKLIYRFLNPSGYVYPITEWNKLDSDNKNIESRTMFFEKLLTFTRHLENDKYGIYDPFCVRLLRKEGNISSNIILLTLLLTIWIYYVHALFKLKTQCITFYTAKITYHFTQPWCEWFKQYQ